MRDRLKELLDEAAIAENRIEQKSSELLYNVTSYPQWEGKSI